MFCKAKLFFALSFLVCLCGSVILISDLYSKDEDKGEDSQRPGPAKSFKGLNKYMLGIAFSPDGKLVAAGDGTGVLCIWEIKSGEILQKLETGNKDSSGHGFGSAIFHLCFSPDGKTLAYCGSGGAWILRKETDSGKGKDQFKAFKTLAVKGSCRGMSFTPDGALLLVGTNNGSSQVIVYKTENWEQAMVLRGRNYAAEAVPVDSSGKLAASGFGTKMANSKKGVIIWDLSNEGKIVAELAGHKREVESVAWHPDKKILAAGDRVHKIRIWDVEKKVVIKEIDTHASIKGFSANAMVPVEFLAFDPKGKWLAATTLDGMLNIYSAETYEELVSIYPQGDDVPQKGQVGLAVSNDGEWIAAGGGENNEIVTLWKVSELLGK